MEEGGATARSSFQKQKLDDNEELIGNTRTYGEDAIDIDDDDDEEEEEEGLLLQSDQSSLTITVAVILSALVAACGSYAFGNAVGYSSPAESGIEDDLGLSSAEYAVFGSVLTIGAMLGAMFSGKIADFVGRRCVPVYIAEITPKNVRGGFTSLTQLMMGSGQALAFLIGSLVSWRTLALIGIIPCLVHLLGLFFIPESPRWLAKCGRAKEVEAVLQFLRGKDADISQEASDIIEYTVNLQLISEEGIRCLFQRKYSHSIMIGVGLMVFQQFGGLNGFGFYASTIFKSAGCSIKLGTIAAAVVQILMTAVSVFLIDKCGRLPLLLISAAGTCIGCSLTGFAFFLQDLQFGKDLIAMMVLIGVLVYWASFELGMGGIPWIMMSEIFPINIKCSAGSLVTLVSWIGSWFTSYTFNFLFEWSSAGAFFIYAGICGIGILFIAKMVPETKNLALEEIHLSITA